MDTAIKTRHSGTKVGTDLFWIDVNRCTVGNADEIAVVTIRRSHSGGGILAREIASPSMATSLRSAATAIDQMISQIATVQETSDAADGCA